MSHSTYRTIVVDDEKLARSYLLELLEQHEDVEVIATCKNGFEAVKACTEEKPDLMFLDIMMPKKNGYEVCEEIKQDPGLNHIYIIMLTAKGQATDKARGEEVQADEYITKPFNPDEILQKASDILNVQI